LEDTPIICGLVRATTRFRLVRAVLAWPTRSRCAIGAGVATAAGLLVVGIVVAAPQSARPIAVPVAAAAWPVAVSPSASAPATQAAEALAATVATPTSTPPTSAVSPADTVRAYFADINGHNFSDAWALGGKSLQGGTYDSFVPGFSRTAHDDVTVVGVSGGQVNVELTATNNDGSVQLFTGTYQVTNGLLVSAHMHQISNTASTDRHAQPGAPAQRNPPAPVPLPPAYDYVDCAARAELPHLADEEEQARIDLVQAQLREQQTRGLDSNSLVRRQALLDLSVAQKNLSSTQANAADVRSKAAKVTAAQCR
jgi:hypothetical protein